VTAYRLRSRLRLRELTLMASSMISIIGTTAIAASLPYMSDAFAATPDGDFLVRVSLTLPALSIALFAPLLGLGIDRWGRKRLFVASLVAYGVAGTAGLVLPALHAILVSRFLLGVAVAGVMTCATALIADYADELDLGRFMGRQSLFMALGNVVFVSLGGVLAEFGWRWPFAIYAIAFAVLPGAILLIADVRRSPGAASLAPGGPAAGHPPAGPPAANRPPAGPPVSPPKGRTLLVYVVGFVNMIVYFMVPVYLPFHLSSFPGNTSTIAGALLALVGLTWGLGSWRYPRLRLRLSFEQITIGAFAVMGVAHLLLGWATGYVMVVAALALIGAGLGVLIPNLNAWLLSFTPSTMTGRVIGGLVFSVSLGQFLSPTVTRPLSAAAGFARSYLAAGALLLLAAGAGVVLTVREAATRRLAAAAEPRR
jgi:MFS family permease